MSLGLTLLYLLMSILIASFQKSLILFKVLKIFASSDCQVARETRWPCSIPWGMFSGHGFSPFPPSFSLFSRSGMQINTWRGSNYFATKRWEAWRQKSHSQDGGSRKHKSLLSLLCSLGLPQKSTMQGKLIT